MIQSNNRSPQIDPLVEILRIFYRRGLARHRAQADQQREAISGSSRQVSPPIAEGPISGEEDDRMHCTPDKWQMLPKDTRQ